MERLLVSIAHGKRLKPPTLVAISPGASLQILSQTATPSCNASSLWCVSLLLQLLCSVEQWNVLQYIDWGVELSLELKSN
eukprot:m.33461 g.33461  ORF g.33461 m.33461 type:complete len:80 (+) comp16824_c0_seq2:1405-1644(+)